MSETHKQKRDSQGVQVLGITKKFGMTKLEVIVPKEGEEYTIAKSVPAAPKVIED